MKAGLAGVLALAWALAPVPLTAQALAPLEEGRTGGAVGQVHVEARPSSPATGLALVLPVGSARDAVGLEGTARVLAGVVARRVDEALGPDGGTVQVEVTPERTTFRVSAVGDHWPAALQALLDAAFRDSPRAELVAAEVAALQEVTRFEAGAPILDVRAATRALLYGAGSPAVRPPGGTARGLAALTAADAAAFQTTHYRASDAAVAVVGVGDETGALALLGVPAVSVASSPAAGDSLMADTLAPVLAPSPAVAPPERGYGGPLPWTQGDRVRIAQEVTSTWIAVAYPVPADLPATLLEFVAQRLHEELNPSPPDPGLFSVRVEVRPVPGGQALVVEAAVLPDDAERWEARILEAVRSLATPADDAFFRWQRRRFRSAVLLAEAAPEASAVRRASDLLTLGGVRSLAEAVWALDAAALAGGAAALGPPRILVYGPDLEGGESGGRP